MEYLFSNHLIVKCQFGFRSYSSTQEAFLTVTNDWHSMLSTHHQVASIFFDSRKAFDPVPLLFIVFMNSISNVPLSTGAKLLLFADDLLLYKLVST